MSWSREVEAGGGQRVYRYRTGRRAESRIFPWDQRSYHYGI